MKKEDRKKLTASEYYLQQLMSILYTKLKVIVSDDEKVVGRQVFNLENYEHGTISVTEKNGAIIAKLDGTNFVAKFYYKKDGSVAYRNDQLGIEYILSQKELNEQVKIKSIIRKVGDSADYMKYLVADDNFFVVLDFYKKDEKGTSSISNNIAHDYNDQELIDYVLEQMEKAQELEKDADDSDEVNTEEDVLPQSYEDDELCDDEEEIQSLSCEDNYDDYLVIDYQSDAVKNENDIDRPYSCDLPSMVQDFDYEQFIKKSEYVNYVNGAKLNCKPGTNANKQSEAGSLNSETKKTEQLNMGCQMDEVSEDDFTAKIENVVSEIYDDLVQESDLVVTSEGFVNEDIYDLTVNGESVFDESKSDYVDDFFVEVQDIDMEVTTISDYCRELSNELDKMKEIISRRKKQIEKNKNKSMKKENNDNIDIE